MTPQPSPGEGPGLTDTDERVAVGWRDRVAALHRAARRASYIQGFKYGDTYVVRDVLRDPAEQELWCGADREEFEARCELLSYDAVAAALATEEPTGE